MKCQLGSLATRGYRSVARGASQEHSSGGAQPPDAHGYGRRTSATTGRMSVDTSQWLVEFAARGTNRDMAIYGRRNHDR